MPNEMPYGEGQKKSMTTQHLPWWQKDNMGYPIEQVEGKPVSNAVRILFQNIRKLPLLK